MGRMLWLGMCALGLLACSRTLTKGLYAADGSCDRTADCRPGAVCVDGTCIEMVDNPVRDPGAPSSTPPGQAPRPDRTPGSRDPNTALPADPGPQPVCGNGVREANEACDGMDFGGVTCERGIFSGGQLACFDNCQLDISGCTTGQSMTEQVASVCHSASACGSFGVVDPGVCILRMDALCLDCIRGWVNVWGDPAPPSGGFDPAVLPGGDDDDAGMPTLCDLQPDPACADACAGLTDAPRTTLECRELGVRLGFDGPCACGACQDALEECYAEPECARIFACAMRTGCEGPGCLESASCGGVIRALEHDYNLRSAFDAASCVRSASCGLQ